MNLSKEPDKEIKNKERASVELGQASTRVVAKGKFRDKDALDFVPTPESVLLHIDTPNYDGPLDLLLHLIKKHSMDIFDIPIVLITKKYLAVLDEMRELNLDVAGEFLVMAATLAQIKSKMLLPKEEQLLDQENGDENLDPRAQLIKRLLIYKTFREAALKLAKQPTLGGKLFFRPKIRDEDDEEEYEEVEILAPIEIFELIETLSKTLKKADDQVVHTITRERISISARIHDLIDYCQIRTHFSFYDALKNFPIETKTDVIVTFLALLEMSRLKLLRINLADKEDLRIELVKENFYTKQKEVLENLQTDF